MNVPLRLLDRMPFDIAVDHLLTQLEPPLAVQVKNWLGIAAPTQVKDGVYRLRERRSQVCVIREDNGPPWEQDYNIFAEMFRDMNDEDRRIIVEFSRLIAAQARRRRRAMGRRTVQRILGNDHDD